MNDQGCTALDAADIKRVMALLPHRYPFLMIDRIVDIDGDSSAVGIKNVTVNEPHFQGHFPGEPVMPGVLVIEGMAQTAGAICALAQGTASSVVYLMTLDRVKFRRPIVPGDTAYYHVRKMKRRHNIWRFSCQARVDGDIAAEAQVSAMLVER